MQIYKFISCNIYRVNINFHIIVGILELIHRKRKQSNEVYVLVDRKDRILTVNNLNIT